jgi:hypothetical protein
VVGGNILEDSSTNLGLCQVARTSARPHTMKHPHPDRSTCLVFRGYCSVLVQSWEDFCRRCPACRYLLLLPLSSSGDCSSNLDAHAAFHWDQGSLPAGFRNGGTKTEVSWLYALAIYKHVSVLLQPRSLLAIRRLHNTLRHGSCPTASMYIPSPLPERQLERVCKIEAWERNHCSQGD